MTKTKFSEKKENDGNWDNLEEPQNIALLLDDHKVPMMTNV